MLIKENFIKRWEIYIQEGGEEIDKQTLLFLHSLHLDLQFISKSCVFYLQNVSEIHCLLSNYYPQAQPPSALTRATVLVQPMAPIVSLCILLASSHLDTRGIFKSMNLLRSCIMSLSSPTPSHLQLNTRQENCSPSGVFKYLTTSLSQGLPTQCSSCLEPQTPTTTPCQHTRVVIIYLPLSVSFLQ